MKTVSEESASAAELETPHSMDEAMETGFLPDDEHYRLTGEFKKEKDDTSAAATASATTTEKKDQKDESGIDDASAASSSKAAASETASTQKEEKPGQHSENRWQKRERELRELKAENARLKAKPQTEVRSETAQATTQPATETTAKAAPKPKIDDVDPKTGKAKYKSFAEYEDAKDAWLLDEGARKFQETSAQSARAAQQTQAEREIGQTLIKKFEPVRAKYPDFDKVALEII